MTASGSYDELGRLKTKKRHNGTDTEQFDYNIRNWTTKITSGEFEENLYYNTKPSNIDQATPFYNGNICYSSWTYNGGTRGYQYNYDGLNRYTGGYAYINNVMQVDYQYSEYFNYDKMGNITYLERFSAEDISDQLFLYYNGNQLKYVNDNGIQQSIYGLKDYQNKSTATSDEFDYDANGNMTKDLDRDIVTIRYNLLNLPDTVQFKNGHQIINKYDAGGRKLKTDYFTMIEGVNVPLVNEGAVCNWKYNWDIATQTGLAYVDNFEYATEQVKGDPEYVNLDKVYNAEGYSKYPVYFYYRKDHLGNNREVWHPAYAVKNSRGQLTHHPSATTQATQYYPSGLPWAEGTGAGVQNKKYNGKEWIEMHGLDEYDSQARMYYPAIMRTTTLDPLAEKYYNISPYAWCGNNPIKYIDPDGREVYYAQDGTRLGKIGDNDDIRVINATLSNDDALSHISSGSEDAISALMGNSVAFADYFTSVSDVTNGAKVVPYSGNCYDAAAEQMNNAGYAPEGSRAASTIFTKVGEGTDNPNNLAENTVGGAIKIMTDLNKGKPVMVGLEQTNAVGNYNRQDGNTNPLTSHFVVVNSSTVNGGIVSFNYLDNAGGKGPLNLNTSNGTITGGVTNRGAVKNYTVSEVRNSWRIRR